MRDPGKVPVKFPEAKNKAWMLSFVDTLSILIAFFILIYATSYHAPNVTKTPVHEAFNRKSKQKSSNDLDYIYEIIDTNIKQNFQHIIIHLQKNDDNITISLPAANLFNAYTTELNEAAEKLLASIGDILFDFNNAITINGIDCRHYSSGDYNLKANFKGPLSKAIMIAKKLKNNGYMYNINTYGLIGNEYHLGNIKDKILFLQRIDIVLHDYIAGND
jgi:chemotaxis protein MotB